MSLLIVENVKKHFGAQEILRGASFTIDPGDKIGLAGKNGGGKTTLLRLIEGLEAPDWGAVKLRKGARLGHVPQRPHFEAGVTVRAYVEGGLEEARETVRQLGDIQHAMTSVQGDALAPLMKEHDRLSERVEELGGWELERRVDTVLSGIGLSEPLWDREARTLSGGEKSRTALARELLTGSDLLLLDEPTNHLDLAGIEWIEAYLRELRGAVLVVSHDRRLLDNAVSAILELERGEVTRYPGNYSAYVRLKEERYVSQMRAYESQQDMLRKEEAFIRKHMGSQRTAEAKGRQKKLENIERLPRPYHDVRRPVIRPPKGDLGGELVLEARGLSGGYDGRVLFSNVDLRIARGDRIGIVGRNGIGKTTLLKMLAGRMTPASGSIELGHRARCGYYDQDTAMLASDGTPYTELRRDHLQLSDQEIRDHLARFLFRGNEVDASVASLSGGERARLCLARLVWSDPSWLAMDEPTNHLDLGARTALEEMLGGFEGALVFISHDREFLDGLCTQILELDGGGVRRFSGNYTAWHEKKVAEAAARQVERARIAEKAAAKPVAVPAQPRKPSGGKIRNPYLFEKLEQRIMELEGELAGLHASVVTEDVYRNAQRLKDTQFRIAEIERDLAEANREWEQWIGS